MAPPPRDEETEISLVGKYALKFVTMYLFLRVSSL